MTLADAKRVLVIDDTKAVRSLIIRILNGEDYCVRGIDSGERALTLVQSEAFLPDAALVDLTMPGLNGIAVAEALKQLLPSVRIGIMSGFDRDDTLEAYDLSPDELAFLEKPFSAAQLEVFVAELLDADVTT